MIWVFRVLPHRTAQKLAASIGGAFHDIVGIRKKVARQQLRDAFPDKSEKWINQVPRKVYQNMAMVAAELARVPKLKGKALNKWVDMTGEENLDRVLAKGKGCLIVSAHFGCWEYHGAYAANQGYPVTYVTALQSNSKIEKVIDDLRGSVGIEILKRKNAARGIIKALRRNRLLAIMLDQDAGESGVFVPFFGKPASTSKGVAIFAIKMSASVLVITGHRTTDGISKCHLRPVDYTFTGDKEKDIKGLTAEITRMIEADIRQTPEQWLWLHRRWKTKPNGQKSK